jgi:hypothetical protein
MTNNHLNDAEIQQYILQKTQCNIDIVKHVQNCKTCKIKAKQYTLLFEGIKQQENPVFDFNLADLVIGQLPKSRVRVSNDKSFSYFIFFISLFSLCIILYLFRDSLLSLFKGITPILIGLIITSVISISVFLGIDMYKKYQTKLKCLNFY